MTEKELRKLSRVELLEMLVEISRQNRSLQSRLNEQEAQFQTRLSEREELHTTKLEDTVKGYEAKIAALQSKLNEKAIAIDQAGSIADASAKINGMFEAAQATADQYLSNIRRRELRSREMQKNTEEQIAKRIADAEAEAQKYLEEAKAKAAQMLSDALDQATKSLAEAQKSAGIGTSANEISETGTIINEKEEKDTDCGA